MVALARLPDDKIRALADALEGSIVARMPDKAKMGEIVGAELSESDAFSIARALYNFFVSQTCPRALTRVMDAAPLREDKKRLLKQVLKSTHENADARRIDAACPYGDLESKDRPASARAVPSGDIEAGHEEERGKNRHNEDAYWAFVFRNSDNPEFKDCFVAFVHGRFQGRDRFRSDLVSRMYDKFGNVPAYVGRSSGVVDVVRVPAVVRLE